MCRKNCMQNLAFTRIIQIAFIGKKNGGRKCMRGGRSFNPFFSFDNKKCRHSKTHSHTHTHTKARRQTHTHTHKLRGVKTPHVCGSKVLPYETEEILDNCALAFCGLEYFELVVVRQNISDWNITGLYGYF